MEALTVSRYSQVEKAASPRKSGRARQALKNTVWVMSSASSRFPTRWYAMA